VVPPCTALQRSGSNRTRAHNQDSWHRPQLPREVLLLDAIHESQITTEAAFQTIFPQNSLQMASVTALALIE